MDFDTLIKNQIEKLNLDELNDIVNNMGIHQDAGVNFNIKELILNMTKGEAFADPQGFLMYLLKLLAGDIASAVILGLELVLIGIVVGMLRNLATSFGDSTVSKVAVMVCGAVVMGVCLGSFISVYQLCVETVKTMTLTMNILLPIIFTLMLSMGSVASGNVLNTFIMGAVAAFSNIIQRFIMPAIYLSSIFILANTIIRQKYIKRIGVFLRTAAVFAMGISITIFTGLTSIQGIMAKSADGLLIKTAKYSVKSFVPFVGGFTADSLEMIMNCSQTIKNGLGVVGLVLILLLLVNPIIKVIAIIITFKVTAIVVEPLGNDTISDCISELGNTAVILAVSLFLSAMMYFIFLSVLLRINIF